MNGPIKMYRTKQIIKHDLPVELPKCMYALKNIHSNSKSDCGSNKDHAKASNKKLDIFDQVKQFLKVLFVFVITFVFNNFAVGNNLELLVTPLPILGEVNLLRYLVRVTEAPLNYDSDQDFHEIDSLLDSAYLVVKSRTKTERTSFLQFLNKSLGKSQWLAGRTTASIADIAAYSAIRQVSNAAEMTVNLGKWFQRCETLV
nr:probable aminoacyl tRNA synthase complex-interacting multifunctional protein 2 [Leptinotarsa decemlineata]